MIAFAKNRPPGTAAKNKAHTVVGLEFDAHAIRALRVNHAGASGYRIESLCEERGDFKEDTDLLDGLRKVKSRLSIGAREHVVTALAGKQVWAGEIQFRPLPPHEMVPALKLEVRKILHFEANHSALDYQVLSEANPQANQEFANLLVVAAHNTLLNKQIKWLEKSGMRVAVVEVLPVAVMNAVWAQVGISKGEAAHVGLHFGPQVCTVCIDGEKSPFFNRSIYFSAEEVFGQGDPLTGRERERRLQILGEEIGRTLAYYEKNSLIGGFQSVSVFGDFSGEPGLTELVQKYTGMMPAELDVLKRFGYSMPAEASRFALSLALALREDA